MAKRRNYQAFGMPDHCPDSDNYHERALEVTVDSMRKYLAGCAGEMSNLVAH